MIDDYPCPLSIESTYEKENDLNSLPFIENEIKGKNNILYNIKIYNAKNSIKFNIKKYNDFLVINYLNEYTFEQLNKIDIFFKSFKSIEEIYIDFFQNYNKKEINVLENENKLNLIIKFEHLSKMKKIKFNFDVYNLNMEKTIFKLCDKMKEIDKFNINIKEKITEQQNIIENNDKKIDGKIKKIKEKNNNKDMLDKFNKLKEEIKINEEICDKIIKDNQTEINENNKKVINIFKNQIEEKRKYILLFNSILIVGFILLNSLIINTKFNYKINNIDNKYKNKITDLDNKYNNSINDIEHKYDYKINNIDYKYDYKINDISNKVKELEKNYNKDLFTYCLSKIRPIADKYLKSIQESNNQKVNKISILENKINKSYIFVL